MNKEVKNKNNRKISVQKIFNLTSFAFILACCIFYGTRFIKLYIENNKSEEVKVLADNIKENNEDNDNFKNIKGNYYFSGNDVNNYLSYSNLIWRIIKINSDNTVTLALESPITALAAGEKKDFKASYLNKWLNDSDEDYTGILSKNLHDIDNYLTYTKTCIDKIDNTKNITCNDIEKDLLITVPSLDDYVNTGGNQGFLNSGHYYYLASTNKDGELWYINSSGNTTTSDGTDVLGVKPMITLKSIIKLVSGNGSKENPYTIETEHGLFGSYVKLGNEVWRVYDIEESLAKLSLNSYLSLNGNDARYRYSSSGYYHNDTKSGSLAYYLKNTFLNSTNYKDDIPETKFANGLYSNQTDYDYTKVLSTTVDTKVATLSIGNPILNTENNNYFTTTGLTEDGNLMYVMRDDFKLYTNVATANLKIVPVLAINKDLLTKGDGTIESPYEVEHE